MGLIDIVCLVFLVVWLLLGFRRGVLFELLSLAVALGAFLIAYLVHPMLVDIAGRFLNYNATADRLIFLVSFIIVLVIIQMLSNRIVGTLGELTEAGIVFKVLGAVSAVPRGALYLSVVLWLIVSFSPDSILTKRINDGLVTGYGKQVVTVVYNQMDDILRKGHISSFTVNDLLK